jgi:hypothetical protein
MSGTTTNGSRYRFHRGQSRRRGPDPRDRPRAQDPMGSARKRQTRRRAGDSGDRPLYLLMLYAKARQENLSAEEKKAVRKLAAILRS